MTLSPVQLHILQHSLGCDDYGLTPYSGGKEGPYYRNRFFTNLNTPDGQQCQALVVAGLMMDHGAQELAGKMHLFTVTPAGIAAMKAQSPKPPKKTRAEKRYEEFLNEDSGLLFGEWLKVRKEREVAYRQAARTMRII